MPNQYSQLSKHSGAQRNIEGVPLAPKSTSEIRKFSTVSAILLNTVPDSEQGLYIKRPISEPVVIDLEPLSDWLEGSLEPLLTSEVT